MQTSQIQLIRQQFAGLRGQEAAFAASFYDRLFRLSPQLRMMFPAEMGDQSQKLMSVLAFAVNHLDRPETLAPAVVALGARHANYGVRPDHFSLVGVALIETLAAWLGDAFDFRAMEAWGDAYGSLAGLMEQGLRGDPATRAAA